MSLHKDRLAVLKQLNRSHLSNKDRESIVRAHEERVIAYADLSQELLEKYLPEIEAKNKALENFIIGLHGKFITDVDPLKTPLKELRKRFEKIDIEALFGPAEQAKENNESREEAPVHQGIKSIIDEKTED